MFKDLIQKKYHNRRKLMKNEKSKQKQKQEANE